MSFEDPQENILGAQLLEELKKQYNHLTESIGYGSNNPDENRSRIAELAKKIRDLEKELKIKGELPVSESEKISFQLDKLYPNARSKTVVEFEGKKYEIRYFPIDTSRSGKTVKEWGHEWKLKDK